MLLMQCIWHKADKAIMTKQQQGIPGNTRKYDGSKCIQGRKTNLGVGNVNTPTARYFLGL